MQDNVRQRLIIFLNETGTKQNYVCRQIGLPVSIFTRFKKEQRALTTKSLSDLDSFLISKGF